MGNEASVERDNDDDTNEGTTTIMAATFLPSPASATSSGPRRIVKASKPIPPAPSLDDNDYEPVVETKEDEEEEDDDGSGSKKDIPLAIAESPSVAREVEQEKLEMIKRERKLVAEQSHKAKREKLLQERRRSSGAASSNKAPLAQANPMSRFLSVFSVEPKYPEHKRAYEEPKKGEGDPASLEPDSKKPRQDLDGQEEGNDEATGGTDAVPQSPRGGVRAGEKSPTMTYVVAASVAVAAVAVGMVLRTMRSK